MGLRIVLLAPAEDKHEYNVVRDTLFETGFAITSIQDALLDRKMEWKAFTTQVFEDTDEHRRLVSEMVKNLDRRTDYTITLEASESPDSGVSWAYNKQFVITIGTPSEGPGENTVLAEELSTKIETAVEEGQKMDWERYKYNQVSVNVANPGDDCPRCEKGKLHHESKGDGVLHICKECGMVVGEWHNHTP